jgi:uncharacterized membrane protein
MVLLSNRGDEHNRMTTNNPDENVNNSISPTIIALIVVIICCAIYFFVMWETQRDLFAYITMGIAVFVIILCMVTICRIIKIWFELRRHAREKSRKERKHHKKELLRSSRTE